MNDTTTVLAQVLEAGDILHLIREESLLGESHNLFNGTMAAILNSVSLESVYKNAFEVFAENNRDSFCDVLELLNRLLSAIKPSDTNILKPAQLTFWYLNVLPLIFDENDTIRNIALATVEKIVPFVLISNYQVHAEWPHIKTVIIKR